MRKHYLVLLMLLFGILQQTLHAQSTVPSDAHRAREAEYDLNFFFPDLDIEDYTTFISGNVLMRATTVATTMDTFAVEMWQGFYLDSVVASLNGGGFADAPFRQFNTELNVLLPFTAHTGDVVAVQFYYHGIAPLFSTNSNGAMYTGYQQCYSVTEPYYAYTLFPCKQVLTDKADSSWFNITTSDSLMAISNGLLNNVTNLGNGKKRWQWHSHHAIAYYLVSFAIGHFELTTRYFHPEGRSDSMPVQFYDFAGAVDTTYYRTADNALHIYSKLFGLYPFYDEKLSYTNLNYGGGMENQTAISLSYIPWVLAHETAHQWFGDNVTCASFKDVMVNEGFAHWCESIYNEFSGGGDSARIDYFNSDEHLLMPSSSNRSGYCYGDTSTIYGPFDPIADYSKNGMMLNTLRFLVNNDSVFFLGLRNYQTAFHASNAYGANLRDVMEQTTGLSLDSFFSQFYYGFGYPIFSADWNQVNDTLILRVYETTSCDTTPLYQTPLQIKIYTSTGDTTVRLTINNNITDHFIPISGTFDSLKIDPNQWLLNGTAAGFHDPTLRDTVTPHVVVTTGITQTLSANHYTVYPDPATTYIDISSSDVVGTPLQVVLYNMLGQRVYETTTFNRMYLPALANGVYVLQINGEDWVRVEVGR